MNTIIQNLQGIHVQENDFNFNIDETIPDGRMFTFYIGVSSFTWTVEELNSMFKIHIENNPLDYSYPPLYGTVYIDGNWMSLHSDSLSNEILDSI